MTAPAKLTIDELIAYQKQLCENYQPNPVVYLIAKSILATLEAHKRITESAGRPEPVGAQHRFRHPQKTMPDWSPWQPCAIADRPAWTIDSVGYEVEYRNIYGPDLLAAYHKVLAEVDRFRRMMPDIEAEVERQIDNANRRAETAERQLAIALEQITALRKANTNNT